MESITKPAQVLQPPENSILHPVEAYLDRRSAQEPVHLVQYDMSIPVLAVALFQKDKPYAVPAGATVNLRLSKPDGTCVYDPVLGLSQDRQTVYVQVSRQMTAAAGLANAILEILLNGGVVGTAAFLLFLEANPVTDDAIFSSDEFKSLDDYVNQAEASAEQAADSASKAAQSQQAAAASASAAASSAAAAKGSEDRAEASAKAASQSASDAAGSAEEAAASASAAEKSAAAAKASQDSASGSASAASTSAAAAKASQDAAAGSASAAKTSQEQAAASATAAKASQDAAKASQTAAASSAEAAKGSESKAEASAKAASQSASDAAGSAEEAAASASAAEKSAAAAKASQDSASGSASAASTSAAAAKASQDAAAASQSAAAASAAAAKTSETAAKASETAAGASATAAKNSQTAAEASKTAAAGSASDAAGSAEEAAASASAAEKSAAAAKASQDSASGSASAASTSAAAAKASQDAAAASQSAAAASASAAKTSETAAKASETAAGASATAAKNSQTAAEASKTAAAGSAAAAAQSATAAAASAKNVEDMSNLAESYAVGGTDTRPNEDADNAKYYYEQAKGISQGLAGSLLPMGTVAFALLQNQTKEPGYMYNISDAFTTDSSFKEGAGHPYPAGTNVYWTADHFWDCLAGTQVVSVAGRTGTVTLTKADVGLGQVDNTPDSQKSVASAATAAKVGHDLKFEGGATGTWNGSEALTVKIPTIPGALKNPNALTFTGGSSVVYDGSAAQTVAIPTTLPASGGTSAACSGNAATATKFAATHNINGVAFDGSKDITVRADPTMHTATNSTAVDAINPATGFYNIEQVDMKMGDGSYHRIIALGDHSAKNYATEIAFPYQSGVNANPQIRTSTSYAWSAWKKLAFHDDITSYAPAKGGTGATGTWGIGISGNAATATKLAAPKKINGVAFDGSQDITVADSTKLPLAGGTLTGDLTMSGAARQIKYASGKRTASPISFYAGDENGSGVVIGDGGRTIIGGGEAAQSLRGVLTTADSGEELHLANDGPINLHTNCQTIASRRTFTFQNDGRISNVANPTATTDVANKSYVDSAAGARLPLTGGTMTGNINMGSHTISGLSNPTAGTDAANKQYVDSAVAAKQADIFYRSVTLTVAGWSATAKTQKVTVSGVVAAETSQLIIPTPALTSRAAYQAAGIQVTAQGANSLTFTAETVPTVALTVYVVIIPL